MLLLYAIKNRLEFSMHLTSFAKDGLLLISVAIVMIILLSWGASWLHIRIMQ
jgi:hypothetical protein